MSYKMIYKFGYIELYINGKFYSYSDTWTDAAKKLDEARSHIRKRK